MKVRIGKGDETKTFACAVLFTDNHFLCVKEKGNDLYTLPFVELDEKITSDEALENFFVNVLKTKLVITNLFHSVDFISEKDNKIREVWMFYDVDYAEESDLVAALKLFDREKLDDVKMVPATNEMLSIVDIEDKFVRVMELYLEKRCDKVVEEVAVQEPEELSEQIEKKGRDELKRWLSEEDKKEEKVGIDKKIEEQVELRRKEKEPGGSFCKGCIYADAVVPEDYERCLNCVDGRLYVKRPEKKGSAYLKALEMTKQLEKKAKEEREKSLLPEPEPSKEIPIPESLIDDIIEHGEQQIVIKDVPKVFLVLDLTDKQLTINVKELKSLKIVKAEINSKSPEKE